MIENPGEESYGASSFSANFLASRRPLEKKGIPSGLPQRKCGRAEILGYTWVGSRGVRYISISKAHILHF